MDKNVLSLEEQLAECQKQLADKNLIINTILESTLAGYWDWFIQDNTEYLSPTFKKMFGYEDHEMENKPESWQAIIHPDDLAEVYECFNKHVESKGEIPYNNTVRYYHKNGSIVHVYCKGQVVEWDAEDKPIRMIGAHIDITPMKKIEDTLSIKNGELEEFAYATSHDLKEPLRTISSFIELLQVPDIETEKQNMYLNIISQSASRMTSLIQGLLDHSRLGKELKTEQTDLNLLIENVTQDLNHSIVEKNGIITCDKTLPIIEAYPTELRVLFQNLISNAIKFTTPGASPCIQINYTTDAMNHIISVKDNGIGIAKDKQDRVFNLFSRLNAAEEYEGTGIGLTHCKKIAHLHNGEIKVTSEKDKGSTFSIYIPKQLNNLE